MWAHLAGGEPGPELPPHSADGRVYAGCLTAATPPRRVYTDMQPVLDHLTHPRFTLTQSEADADILYNFSHFKDYR